MTYLKFEFNGAEYSIDRWLASQLDSIAYNLKSDWDFVLLITGDRSVRVGKSVLAMTICAYLSWCLKKLHMNDNAYQISDVYFDNKTMISDAQHKPKYSINHYDEGREGLAANKAMREFQQDLMDFFAECGQLNHIFVIVCPDFFELKEQIAVGRSEILINVYRKADTKEMDIYREGVKRPITVFRRGYFEFFNRNKKARLYDLAKTTRKKSYSLVKCDFFSNFPNQYPLNEAEYKQKKKDSLARFDERHKEQKEKPNQFRNRWIANRKAENLTGKEIQELYEKETGKTLSIRQINDVAYKIRGDGSDLAGGGE